MGRNGNPYSTDSLINLSPNITGREKDLLMNTGEMISACIFAQGLKCLNIDNLVLTGGQAGIETDDNFNNATILNVNPNRIKNELKFKDVIIVTGFQGNTLNGDITTLGRGGSDTSAVALGISIDAKRVDIFTDVSGIMTTDPKITDAAKTIKEASYNEILNLSYSGAEIVHPRAIELAMNYGVKLVVKPTFSQSEGTIISKATENKTFERKGSLITGLAHKTNLAKFSICIPPNDQMLLFRLIKERGISLDMITINKESVSFVINNEYLDAIRAILKDQNMSFTESINMAKIALVGEKISGVSGVMGDLISILYKNDIKVFHSTDSNTTLWILIDEANLKPAIISLHNFLFD